MKSLHAVLILIILFGVMSAASWERWANPIIDGGREMNTPLRLLQGEQIYSEVYYLYGPVAPFFNALLYKIFGIHLHTLYAAGLAGGLLLVLLIFHLGRKFMSVFEAMLAAVAVLLLCVFKQRGNMIFPYSYAVLYGTLLGTLALAAQLAHIRSNRMRSLFIAGALSGLTLCCKLEFGFAAIASLVALAISSPRSERLRNAGIALLAVLIFPLLIYGFLLARIPAGPLLKDTFLLPGHMPAELIYFNKVKLGLNDPGRTFREFISAAALLFGAAGIFSLAGIRMTGGSILSAPRAQGVQRLWWITGIGWGLILVHMLFYGSNWDLNPFRALPILFAGMIYYYFAEQAGSEGKEPSRRSLLLLSVYSLAVLVRVLVRVPAGGAYGSGLVPVPILLFFYIANRDFPIIRLSPAAARFRRRLILIGISIPLAAVMGVLIYRQAEAGYVPLRTPRGELRFPSAHISAMNQAIDFIARNTSRGEFLLALPEGSSLNFLANRPVPVRYEIVTPGFVRSEEERTMIHQIQEKKVRYIFLFNRPTSEFGPKIFGQDYCRTLMEWINSNFELAAVFGEHTTSEMQIGDPQFFIKCYRKKDSGQSAVKARLPCPLTTIPCRRSPGRNTEFPTAGSYDKGCSAQSEALELRGRHFLCSPSASAG